MWLAPEMVDFSTADDRDAKQQAMASPKSIHPIIATLLEDVRTRGDRQHPFWAKVE